LGGHYEQAAGSRQQAVNPDSDKKYTIHLNKNNKLRLGKKSKNNLTIHNV